MKIGYLLLPALLLVASFEQARSANIEPSDIVINDGVIEKSLTGVSGDPVNGRKVFINRKQGNCLACHTNMDASEQSFHGEVGPGLDGVADRWTAPELRAILVNSKSVFEGTIMPGFYTFDVGVRVADKFKGKTILSAQEVEDVLAYLLTLKET